MSELIKLETLNAVEVYSSRDVVDELLKAITDEVESFVHDLSTLKGRKEVASLAYKVSQSKTALDNLGKDLVTGWKAQSKKVDGSRKHVRDSLDALRDKVRQPLTDWENAEKKRIEDLRLAKENEERIQREQVEFDQRKKEEALARREADIAAKEKAIEDARIAEVARVESERVKAENARLEAERQEQIKTDAEENARKKVQDDLDAAKRREDEQTLKAELAERDRLATIEQAKVDQAAAVQKAKEDAEWDARHKESSRIAEENRLAKVKANKEAEEKRIADAKAANQNHRKSFNNKAVEAFMDKLSNENFQCTREHAIEIVTVIAREDIPNVTINY